MLRSLNNLKEKFNRNTCSLGVSLSRQGLQAVYATVRSGSEPTVQWVFETSFDRPVSFDAMNVETEEVLGNAFALLSKKVARRFVPVKIALPDSALALSVLELDEIPRDEKGLGKFIQWRMEQEQFIPANALTYTHQNLEKSGDKILIQVSGFATNWLTALTRACEKHYLFPDIIDSSMACYLHMLLSDSNIDSRAGMLLTVDADSWSFAVWDNQLRPRYYRSAWRCGSSEKAATEFQEIAGEINRARHIFALKFEQEISVVHVLLRDFEDRDLLVLILKENGVELSDVSQVIFSSALMQDRSVNLSALAVAGRL